MDGAPDRSQRALWPVLALFLALVGVALSVYSTMHHLEVRATGATDAACNINATFNCDEVARSEYAEPIGGIPLGVFGLGFFVAEVVLLAVGLRGGKSARDHLQAYAALVAIGILTSIGLGTLAVTNIGAYCLVCMGIYLVCLLQGIHLLVARRQLPGPFALKGVVNGGWTAAIAVAAVIAAFQALRPKLTPTTADTTPKPEVKLLDKVEEIPFAKSAYAGLGEDYRKGSDNAPVVIQEFADFQCPACRHMSTVLRTVAKDYGDKILIVFRNYPLDNSCNSSIQHPMHEYACQAAVLARCAGQYGKFWEYFAQVYDHQNDINQQTLRDWAKGVGLTDEQISTCEKSKDIMDKIKSDVDLGNKLGVDSTPSIFINGRKAIGVRDVESLHNQIDPLLK